MAKSPLSKKVWIWRSGRKEGGVKETSVKYLLGCMKEMGPATTVAHRSRGKVQMGMLSQKEIRTSLIAEVGEHLN